MLKTTSQQIIDRIGVGPDEVGRPVVLGSTVDLNAGSNGNAVLKAIPKGYVLLATKILSPTGGMFGLSGLVGTKDALLASPNSGTGGSAGHFRIDLEQTTGDSDMQIRFQRWARYASVFGVASSPDFRRSLPANPAAWEPKYPLVIPSGWKVNTGDYSAGSYGEAVPGPCIYGVLVTEGDAQMLGYCTANTSPATERYAGVASSAGTGSSETLIAARAGYSIRILDIHLRFQPSRNINTSITLQQDDGSRTIIKWTSSNPAEMIERSISPDIFLKGGSALNLITTTADVQTVNVSYEYVKEDDIPVDAFWGEVHPAFGSPGAGTIGTASVYTAALTALTLYYPGRDTQGLSSVTATVPGKGRQHLLRGYSISAQKDGSGTGTTDDVDQAVLAIVAAPSSSDTIGFSHTSAIAIVIGDSTVQLLTPLLPFGGHDQNLTFHQDNLNLPAKEETGQFRVDVLGMSYLPGSLATALTPGDGDVTDWSVTVWGRTIPTRFTAPISRTF